MRQAVAFLLLQLAIGAAVLLSLNRASILLGIAVLGLIGTYPFMKRITYWPQVFLGLNFNWGALIGWTAVAGALAWPALLLYLGGVFWTIGYDTIYAHQDKEDDALHRRQILGLGARASRPGRGSSCSMPPRCCCGAWRPAPAGLGGWFWAGLAAAALQLCLAGGSGSISTSQPIASLNSARTARSAGWCSPGSSPAICSERRCGPRPVRPPQHRDRRAAAGAGDPPPSGDRDHPDLAGDRREPGARRACRRRSGPSPGPAARRWPATCSIIPQMVAGRVVLDFGSGSGLVAIAAAKAGARPVLAAEIDHFAAAAIAANAALNDVAVQVTTADLIGVADRAGKSSPPATSATSSEMADRAIPVAAQRSPAAAVWCCSATPAAPICRREGLRERARYTVPTSRELEDRETRDGVVWQVLPA